MSTAEKVKQVLSGFDLKRQSEREWRCNNPLRPGSNSHAFALTLDDDEHGAYYDHVTQESGSLYELAELLNIELPQRGTVVETKRAYTGLADYAAAHGVDAQVFINAGWRETVYGNRPALAFKVGQVDRYRMLDNEPGKPFAWGKGYTPAWYGLERAIRIARSNNSPVLVLCNGEPSTVVAQHYNIPAFCHPGGEKAIPSELLTELYERWNGTIWIALDCDSTGRKAAKTIHGQLRSSHVLDLGLSEHGDLADFCRLHGTETFEQLYELVPPPPPEPEPDMISHSTVALQAIRDIEMDVVGTGYPLIVPFPCMHHLGGLAEVLTPGKVMLLIAPSAGGKTSFLETWADYWNMHGISGAMRGDEWNPKECHDRRIQRYAGISWNQIKKHELYKTERALKRPANQSFGVRLTDNQIQHYQEVSMGIAEWSGQIYYYNASRHKRSLEDSLEAMSIEIQARRRAGQIMGFAIFDYVQLLKSAERPVDDNAVEFVFGKIKNWTEDNNIVGIVGSQATKAASKDGQKNRPVSAHDAHYVRVDKANLAIVLNMEYEDDPNGGMNADGTPVQFMTERGVADIAKNSGGSPGKVNLIFDYERLQWLNTTTERLSFKED